MEIRGHTCVNLIPTDAVGLHVALVGHAVPPQALVGVASGQTVLHPVVCGGGHHQQNVAHKGTEEASSHETVHPEILSC